MRKPWQTRISAIQASVLSALVKKEERPDPTPSWSELANYNAEVARGIVHTPEYEQYMRKQQALFDLEHERS